MRRSQWKSLDGTWGFAFDPRGEWQKPQDVPEWTHEIQVPFAPESKLSGIGDTGYHQRVWYQRSFHVPRPFRRVLLHFGAVDYEARVWLNGRYLGLHIGGHTPFSFDITDFLSQGEIQVITVRADDDPCDLAKPRGKQDWQLEPHSIWYPRTTGIWQHVWLEEVPEVRIDRLRWTPALERWEVGCEAFITGTPPPGLELRVKLSTSQGILADDIYKVMNHEVHRRIALSDPGIDDYRNELLWSPEKPTLIDAQIELWAKGELIDRVVSYTALRSISVQRGRVVLNGRPYFMRLLLDQGYWPDSLMTAPNDLAFKRDIELVKAAGFNGVRKHQKIEDPDFLYWADKLGLLVWEEMPSSYRFTYESVERLTKEWLEVVERDVNHPCIVVWVPFNESWGVPDLAEKEAHQSCVQALYHLTRTLDPTRLVIGNDGWESTATDILGIHDYDEKPERLLHKYKMEAKPDDILSRRWPGGRMITIEGYPHQGQPIMLTEFGGIACLNEAGAEKRKWGYSVCTKPEELRLRYEKLLAAVHEIEMFLGFCYTQFTDTFQEANGLFTMDRKPKFPLTAMNAATRGSGWTRGELTSAPKESDFASDEALVQNEGGGHAPRPDA